MKVTSSAIGNRVIADAYGKSPAFIPVLILGCLAGIINKLLYSNDAVLYLYLLNLAMVCTDAGLWIRNRCCERTQPLQGSTP